MATYKFQSLEALGPALAEWVPRALEVLAEELRLEVAEQAMSLLEDNSPVGNASRDPHPGKYRASHTPSVGQIVTRQLPNLPSYPLQGVALVASVLAGAPPGATVYIANGVSDGEGSYAGLLEGGRRQYSRVGTRRAQWIGSVQAPDGIYGPAVKALLALRATIVSNAIERAKARL